MSVELTFRLYSDPNCLDLVYEEELEAGSADLIAEKVIPKRVKGQKPAPLKTIQIARLEIGLYSRIRGLL
ncbi:MAG: hypothetical protein ACE5FG_03635 [Myxococcota bacterium]